MKRILLLFACLLSLPMLAQPAINTQLTPLQTCAGDLVTFNLEVTIPELLGDIPQESVVITWHIDEVDAFYGLDPIPPVISVSDTSTIYVRVEEAGNPESFSIAFVELLFLDGPDVQPQEYITCNGAWWPEGTVDLNTVMEQIWMSAGLSPNDVSINFYQSYTDAQAGINPLPSFLTVPTNPHMVHAAATDNFTGCMTIIPVYIDLQDCGGGGAPSHLYACTDTEDVCFDMTPNYYAVLANLDPEVYQVTFHPTNDDAENNTNVIADIANYCVPFTINNTPMFIRLTNTENGEYSVSTFTLVGQQYQLANFQLQSLTQCDEDNDGWVEFNLTVAEMQLGNNPIAYYATSQDADAQVNPILNPAAYPVLATNIMTAVFVREIIEGDCDIVHSLPITPMANCNSASSCMGANALCNSLGMPFQNTVNVPNPGEFGCLGSAFNPTWFYIPVSISGSLLFEIIQGVTMGTANLDVDYVCYGPFTDPHAACLSMLTPNNIVGCSYSSAAIETLNIPNAVAGQYYILMVTNYSNQPGYITISPLGGSGQIDCTGMLFTAFLDSNNNGLQDAGEANFNLGNFTYEKNDDGVVHHYSSQNGQMTLYEMNAANTYDVSFNIDPAYASYYDLATPTMQDVSITPGSGTVAYVFPVTVVNTYQDLAISIVAQQQPNPGFPYYLMISYTNMGNTPVASATVSFANDPLTSILAVSESVTSTPYGFTYNVTDLQPYETRVIYVTLQTPPIPAVELGDLITNSAAILPIEGDAIPENNEAVCTQVVVGSYDPNDKMESRGRYIDINEFGADDYLYYTIRFENTGTAPALNIRINDVLDHSLDASSIRVVAASHDYEMDRVENIVNWKFNQIMLPPVLVDPDGAQGFVHFKVKPLPGFAAGDIIPNTAAIYFDFNPPIITNTFLSEFSDQLRVVDQPNDKFVVYPNPANSHINIMTTDGVEISSVKIYDVTGKIIFNTNDGRENNYIDVSSISSGLYLLEIRDNSGRKATKRIAIH